MSKIFCFLWLAWAGAEAVQEDISFLKKSLSPHEGKVLLAKAPDPESKNPPDPLSEKEEPQAPLVKIDSKALASPLILEIEGQPLANGPKATADRSPSSKKIKKAKIKRDRRFKVPDSKIQTKKRKRISLKDIQPPSSTSLYHAKGSDEAELEQVINEEIKQLFLLLKKNRSAELTLRLGSLYVEKARFISHKIQLDYDKKIEEFKAGRRKTKPSLNLRPAQIYNKKSLKLFEDFRANYPKHKRLDETLFFLGFNFYQLANETQGIKYFTELETNYPNSFYVYEARFQLGEHYFKLGQWKNSFEYYSKVAQNKRGKFYFFALYKMAWSAYKMDQAGRGLSLLERIIKEGRTFKVVSDRDQVITFGKEAAQDLVLFYTYSSRSPYKAKAFFLNLLGDKKAWPLLRKLAYTYRDTDQTKGVFALFSDLIKQDPTGARAFEYKKQIVETMYNFGKVSQIIKHINEWVRDYGPQSYWSQANGRDSDFVKKAFRSQEVTVRGYALKNHETLRRTGGHRAKVMALNFYKIYFERFKKSPFLDQMSFFYGELLFDSKKYVSAVKSYEQVISRYPTSKYAKPAFVNQVLALEKILPEEAEMQKLVGKKEQAVPLPASIQNFMKVAYRYISKFPKEKNSPSILYRMAGLYYKFNHLSLSAQFFEKLADGYPQSKLAGNVGGILLDIYNKNKDYKSLEKLAFKLSKNKSADKELLKEVKSILEQISFKKAQDLALDKKYKESAELYKKFAKSYPGSSLAPSAFYNAGLNFEKTRDRLKAIAMYSAVLTYKGRGHRKIRKNSQKFLATLYEKLGFYKKSANAYVFFAKSYPGDPQSSDFWYNAGIIFDGLNDIASAVYSYQRYFALSKKRDRHEIFYLIGWMFERNKNWPKAISYYGQYLKSSSSHKLRLMKASFAVANIYENKLRKPATAKLWHQKTLNLYKRLKTGVSYGARSHFYLTKSFYDKFAQIKVPAEPKKQEAAVAKKLKSLKSLEQALRPIIRYDDGEQIIASLSLIAQANKEMAQAIYQAPLPKGLNKKGRAQYKAGIKKLIAPYVKKAVEHYQLALEKSQKLELYSEWTGKAYKGLSSLFIVNGQFQKFLPEPALQELWPLQTIDNTGAVTESFIQTMAKSLRYGLSQSDFESLARAMALKKEAPVLKAVSSILSKDPNNVPAINSLALFYLNNNQWGLGTLILNRLSSKKEKSKVILNNLAIVSLKYGNVREAITYLKKALSSDFSYSLARVNLANIFIQQYDYKTAWKYYKISYKHVIKKWPEQGKKATALLSNYGTALTGARQWGLASSVYKKMTDKPSPSTRVLFNYAVFLTEKSRREDKEKARSSLLKAKEIVDELALYSSSRRLKGKTQKLAKFILAHLKELKSSSLKQSRKAK